MATRGLRSLFPTPCNLFHINPSLVLIPKPRARERESVCLCGSTEEMADANLPDQLPPDWVLDIKKKKDGTEVKYYTNLRTGQKFSSKEDLIRYVNYTTTTLPLLNAGWRMDFEGKLHPPEGGSKNRAAGENSSVPATAPDAPLKDQPPEIEKPGDKNTNSGSKKAKTKNKKKHRGSK